MIVVDTSAVVAALIAEPTAASVISRLSENELHAPHLLDIEVASALRGLALGGQVSQDRAADALDDFVALRVERYPHTPLLRRVWDLRGSLTSHDAIFVSLAEALEIPLVTLDPRLANSTGHDARIELLA